MNKASIQLVLNGEQREMDLTQGYAVQDTYLIVYGIAMRTTHGKKTHTGYIWLQARAPGHIYSAQDIINIGYSGMRGNGSGPSSRFGYIGFLSTE